MRTHPEIKSIVSGGGQEKGEEECAGSRGSIELHTATRTPATNLLSVIPKAGQ